MVACSEVQALQVQGIMLKRLPVIHVKWKLMLLFLFKGVVQTVRHEPIYIGTHLQAQLFDRLLKLIFEGCDDLVTSGEFVGYGLTSECKNLTIGVHAS